MTEETQIPQLNTPDVSVSLDSLIDNLKELGYSVFIRNSGSKKVIMWSTKTHWASASFLDSSEDDLKRVCQRLKETIYMADTKKRF